MPNCDQEKLNLLSEWINGGKPGDTIFINETVKRRWIRPMTEIGVYHSTVDYLTENAWNILLTSDAARLDVRTQFAQHFNQGPDALLRHEHMVPCRVLYEEILRRDLRSMRELKAFFERLGCRALVTVEEDNLLNKGQRQSMPSGWDGEDPLARYREAGIKVRPFSWDEWVRLYKNR